MLIINRSSLRILCSCMLCSIAFTTMLFAIGCGKKQAAPVIPPSKDMRKVALEGKDTGLKTGMTYEEVVAFVGGVDGVEVPLPPQPGEAPGQSSIKQYQWRDTSNNMLTCKFQDNKLVEKEMMKLPDPGAPPK